jgi:hypothetical protein
VRCTQFTLELEPEDLTFIYQTGTKMANDEEAEQVFSRKDRKAYRAEVLGGKQRTKAKHGNTKRKASALGKKGSPKAKGRS